MTGRSEMESAAMPMKCMANTPQMPNIRDPPARSKLAVSGDEYQKRVASSTHDTHDADPMIDARIE